MADSSFGEREITIDLNVTGARAVRGVSGPEKIVGVKSVTIAGDPGASGSTIVLRKNNASTGPFFYIYLPTFSVRNNTTDWIDIISNQGLYVQDIGTGWVAGSFMVIRTA